MSKFQNEITAEFIQAALDFKDAIEDSGSKQDPVELLRVFPQIIKLHEQVMLADESYEADELNSEIEFIIDNTHNAMR